MEASEVGILSAVAVRFVAGVAVVVVGTAADKFVRIIFMWAYSSVGRAPVLHSGGRDFDIL